MSRIAEITGNEALQVFLEVHATRWPNWRQQRCCLSERRCWIELPDGIDDPKIAGVAMRMAMPAESELGVTTLGDLWKSFAPVPRDRVAEGAPTCWLLLVEDADPTIGDQVIDQAPVDLERLTLQEITGEDVGVSYAYLIHGEAGRMLAQVPPLGCSAYECESLPRNLLAALPLGWSPPPVLDELWPEGGDRVALYGKKSSTSRDVRILTVTQRLPLARILTMEPTVQVPLVRPLDRIRESPWKVLRAPTYLMEQIEELDDAVRRPAVFRFKTYDRSFALGATHEGPKGHELGDAFLQALDECDVGLLPDFKYAAHDPDEFERWHLLHSDQVDARLLDAWNLVERFDRVDELVRHGLQVFVSAASRMLPPFPAVLVGDDKDGQVIEQIRRMLGNPTEETIVLIEDLDDDSGSAADDGSARSGKPRIIHLQPSGMLPLRDVVRRLIQRWHNAEPIRALAEGISPSGVTEYRDVLEKRLLEIAAEESGELHSAAEATQKDFATWTKNLIDAVERNSVDVRSANVVCENLNQELHNADASIAEAGAALVRLASAVSVPRRAWIAEQTQQLMLNLQTVAPREAEIQAVYAFAESSIPQLRSATDRLDRATVAVQALEPGMTDVGRDAETCLHRAGDVQKSIEAASIRMIAILSQRRDQVAQQLSAATREQARVQGIRNALAAEREVVNRRDRENAAQDLSNTTTRTELDARISAANTESARLEMVRTAVIPAQKRVAADSERKLVQMNGSKIEADLRKVNHEISQLEGTLLITIESHAMLLERREQATTLQTQCKNEQKEHDTAESNATRAEASLVAEKERLKKSIEDKGDTERATERLKLVYETIKKLEQIRTNPVRSKLNPRNWLGGFT